MTKSHSARKKKAKRNVGLTHPDDLSKQALSPPSSATTTTTTGSLKSSTSLGSLKQRPLAVTHLNEGLEDLDHDVTEDHFGRCQGQQTSTQSNARSKHPSRQSSSATSISSLSSTGTINTHISFWNWLTASRVASNLQLLEEQRKERCRYMEHQKRYASSQLSGKMYSELEPEPSDETESEKKLAKHTWDMANVYRAYDLTGKDWAVLGTVTVLSLSLRMWHIDAPDQVILGEGHMGNYVNSYLKNEYSFDVHPPLGKLLLSQIAKWQKYDGLHIFDGESRHSSSFPLTTMRMVTGTMGALVAPIAFLTLKSSGQSVPTAMMAALMVTFDSALTTHNRLIALDSPLLFFSALSILSWNMFRKQSPRPFSFRWWSWLLIAGVAMGGAMSTKLSGALIAATVLLLAMFNMWHLAGDESVNVVRWGQHLIARVGALLALPVAVYLALFYIHFSVQINQPDPSSSIQAEYDLNVLPLSYRNSLIPHTNAPEDNITVWRDVAYGSVIQLTSEISPQMHLHSIPDLMRYAHSSGQQQVAGYAHSDLNTLWLVTRAETTPEDPLELPLRLQYLRNGDIIKLRHLTSRRTLHSHDVRPHCCPTDKLMCEVSAYYANDANNNWVVEVVEPSGDGVVNENNNVPVIALESMIRLRHQYQACHLYVRNNMLAPEEGWGYGRQEIICRKETTATAQRTMWRVTHNVHDFLPLGSEWNSRPKLSFRQRLKESHRMMRTQLRAMESQQTPAAGVSSKPWQWPLAQAMILTWVGDQGQQIAITANIAVWCASTLGLVIFVMASALFVLRQQRGYLERGHVAALKNYHLRDASVYFTGWAISFAPFLFLTQPRAHVLHHYFPSLYFAILVACSVFSGITALLPRSARLALHIGFIALVAGIFVRLTPITYGTPMDANQCRSLDQWLAKTIKLGQPTSSFLDCSFDSPSKTASIPVPHVGKAVPVEKRPVLRARYHHPEVELPYQDAYYLMPFQRAPQQWTKFQKTKPDVHQIQMLKGRLGQDFDWKTYREDRLGFQSWVEQDGMDPWKDQRRAEEEWAKKKLEEEEKQQVLMANQRERKRIEEEKKRVEEEKQRVVEEQRRIEEEQTQIAETSAIATQSQDAPNLDAERVENALLEVMEELPLTPEKDHKGLDSTRESLEESEEYNQMPQHIHDSIITRMAEAGIDPLSGNDDSPVVVQAPMVDLEKVQDSQVEENYAGQIKSVQEPVQGTNSIEARQDNTASPPPPEHAKRAYFDTVIANAQRLADCNKPQDATRQQRPEEAALKPKTRKEVDIAQWLDRMTARANNYAAKIHNEAGGYASFRAQEADLHAQGKKTVKQQLREQQELIMINGLREMKARQQQQKKKTLHQGPKDSNQASGQGRRPPTPKMFHMPGAPPEAGDFPLVGSGLDGIGLGALEKMDSEQLQDLGKQLEPVSLLMNRMIDGWANEMIQNIKSGELKMVQDETGAWVDVSEKKVERAPPLDLKALRGQAQCLDHGQGQGQGHKKPKTDPVTAKRPESDSAPKKKAKADTAERTPKTAKKPNAALVAPVKPIAAQAQAQAHEDARKESARAMEQVQVMRKAREGKKSNADLGFVPVIEGKDNEEKLRLLQDALKEFIEGVQKKAEELEAQRRAKE